MKKIALFMAMAAVALVSCSKDGKEEDKELDVDLTFTSQPGALTYGQPVLIEGTLTAPVDEFVLTGTKKEAEVNTKVGEDQAYKAEGLQLKGEFYPDSKEMNTITVTLKSAGKTKEFYLPVTVSGDLPGDYWDNPAAEMKADKKVATHDNDPENYPEEGTGAGSTTPSFFSMHGVKVGSEVKHILNLDEMREVSGVNGSFAFVNVLQNTSNNAVIGSQRGYAFQSMNALGAGTVGRQCDYYEVNGKKIDSKQTDQSGDFRMSLVRGSWKGAESYDEKTFRFVDSLFSKIEPAKTNLGKIKAYRQLSEIQKVLDNATLADPSIKEPTSLKLTGLLRKWVNAGSSAKSTAALDEVWRPGDYIILRSKRGTEEAPQYYYGIMQIREVYDDKDVFADFNGVQRIDPKKAEDLFLKSVFLDIKLQCQPAE